MGLTEELFSLMWRAVNAREDTESPEVEVAGDKIARSAFAVSDFAAAAIACPAAAVADLLQSAGAPRPAVRVDRTLASSWFANSLRPLGWKPPPTWDPVAGDYETSDHWIRLHTNAPHHREVALRVLGCTAEREAVASALRRRRADDVQEAIVAAGGCAATMHSLDEWGDHPQGAALSAEPLVDAIATDEGNIDRWRPTKDRPLTGIRVLDLTRVLAGPVATRFLAGFGADVLRIDPPGWEESIVAEVTLGKRCARLDAKTTEGLGKLQQLIAGCDVVVHGYRPGALAALGLDDDARQSLRPGLVDVCLSAYGWTGPWRARRGFDSLVQMSSGIADRGRLWSGADRPTPLPFQALDQATGYLMAASVIKGLTVRMTNGSGWRARCALARTAQLLIDHANISVDGEEADLASAPSAPETEVTEWGPALRVEPPVEIAGAPLRWERPAVSLGSSPPVW